MIPTLIALAATAAVQADAPPPAQPADTAAAPGVELWHGARIGMTPAQVSQAFPGAKPVENGESLLDNAKQLLVLSGVRMRAGERATASFYFRGDSLNEVKLVADVPTGQTAANIKRAQAIADSLTPTFGKPTTCGTRPGLLSFECDWTSHGLSVSVTYMDVAGEAPLLETAIRGIVASDTPAAPQPGQPAVPPKAPVDRSPRTTHPAGPNGPS